MFIGIYILLCIITVIHFLRRKLDILTFAAFALIFYTLSCITGEVWITRATGYYYYEQISFKTYLLVYCQLLIINICPHISFRHFRLVSSVYVEDKISKNEIAAFNFICFISMIIFVYNILFVIGLDTFFSNTGKSEIIANTNAFFSYSIWGIFISFSYGIQYKRKSMTILSSIALVILLILGSRSYPVIALLILVLSRTSEIKKAVISYWKQIVLLCVVFVALLVYKEVYQYVRALDFAVVWERLKNWRTYVDIVNNGESRTTFALYNYVVDNNYRIPLLDSFVRIFSVIPFVNNIFSTTLPIRFSGIAKDTIFSSSYGLGSSFWGESYVMGGSLFLITITVIWSFLIKHFRNKCILENKTFPFWATFMMYIAFYIHRLDWVQVWGSFKSVILWYFIFWFLKTMLKRKYEYGSCNR